MNITSSYQVRIVNCSVNLIDTVRIYQEALSYLIGVVSENWDLTNVDAFGLYALTKVAHWFWHISSLDIHNFYAVVISERKTIQCQDNFFIIILNAPQRSHLSQRFLLPSYQRSPDNR